MGPYKEPTCVIRMAKRHKKSDKYYCIYLSASAAIAIGDPVAVDVAINEKEIIIAPGDSHVLLRNEGNGRGVTLSCTKPIRKAQAELGAYPAKVIDGKLVFEYRKKAGVSNG